MSKILSVLKKDIKIINQISLEKTHINILLLEIYNEYLYINGHKKFCSKQTRFTFFNFFV